MTARLLASTASSDHLPGPFTMRNMTVNICAYSDRISCNTAQNPTCGGTGGRGKGEVPRYKEIFVERIATIISATNGIAMSLLVKPAKQQQPANDLKAPDEGCREVTKRNPKFREAANPLVRVDKFQQPFPEKHSSCHESQKQGGLGTVGRGIH